MRVPLPVSASLLALVTLAACSGTGTRSAARSGAQSAGPAGAAASRAMASRAMAPRPAAQVSPGRSASGGGVAFDASQEPLPQVLSEAKRAGRPPMLYFMAEWCGWCTKLRRDTLPDARVGRQMAAFYNVSVDPDTPDGRSLASRYGVNGFPTLVRLDASGNVVDRMEGYRSADDLIGRVGRP